MKTYEIYDARNNQIFFDDPVYIAETGRKALQKHLDKIQFKGKVKVSGSNDVTFKVTPVYIDENGKKWIDLRGGKRCVWYQIQSD